MVPSEVSDIKGQFSKEYEVFDGGLKQGSVSGTVSPGSRKGTSLIRVVNHGLDKLGRAVPTRNLAGPGRSDSKFLWAGPFFANILLSTIFFKQQCTGPKF